MKTTDGQGARGAVTAFVHSALLRAILTDIAIGLLWALLLAVTVLFLSGLSEFIYVDF